MKKLRKYAGLILLFCVFAFLIYYLNSKTFDISSLNTENEYHVVKELTDRKYDGRLAGTEGNRLALSYVEKYFSGLGLAPGGDNGTYYQSFKSMVPMHMSKPYLRILDNSGAVAFELEIGKDYREFLNGFGGNGQVSAPLLYLSDWVRNRSKSQLEGKVVMLDTLPEDSDIEYAIDNGVKGILSPVPQNTKKLPVDTEAKIAKSTMIDLLQADVYNKVAAYAKKGCKIEMKLDEQFRYVDTPNLIGKIDGKDKSAGCIIFSSYIDGFGSEFDGKTYYPGAVGGASGTAMVMELAKVFSQQKHKPDKTIIFALWNNELNGMKGKRYYIENPLFPLADTEVYYINSIGSKIINKYRIDASGQSSQIMRDKMAQFFNNVWPQNTQNDARLFSDAGATAVAVGDNLLAVDDWGAVQEYINIGMPADSIQNLDKQRLGDATYMLLNFVKKELMGDIFGGLFSKTEKIAFGALLLSLLVIYLTNLMNRLKPDLKIGKLSIEDVYYSTIFEIFNKLVGFVCQAGLVLGLLVFLTHIPGNLNLFNIGGSIRTNFSWSRVAADTVEYFRSLWNVGFGATSTGMEVWEYIRYSFVKSFGLLLAVLFIGIILGIAKGIFDAYRDDKRGSLRASGTIMALSLPDVFVVIVLQMLFLFLYTHDIINIPREYLEQRLFVEAFLCLILLPSVYITRIASVAVHEEKRKGYIKAARAKGLSDGEIIRKHLLISVLIKVVEALPSILSLMISNLIIVEYLSTYNGIATNMMLAFRNGETGAYTGLAISLCFLYVVFVFIFRISGKLLNPLKRREI